MKKTIRSLTVITFIAGAILTVVFISGAVLTGCQSSAEKEKNAQDKVQEAKNDLGEAQQDLNQAQQEVLYEYQQFKRESEEKIATHNKSIAEFKARIAIKKYENKAEYEKKLVALEQKNSDLKRKLDEYKEFGKDKWETFKTEFSRDMEEIGKSLKDLMVDNVQ
jgi:predicted RNase H-like nuclease (RuvC/YqgF family)